MGCCFRPISFYFFVQGNNFLSSRFVACNLVLSVYLLSTWVSFSFLMRFYLSKKKKRMEGKVLVQDSFSACVTYVCVCVYIYIWLFLRNK